MTNIMSKTILSFQNCYFSSSDSGSVNHGPHAPPTTCSCSVRIKTASVSI